MLKEAQVVENQPVIKKGRKTKETYKRSKTISARISDETYENLLMIKKRLKRQGLKQASFSDAIKLAAKHYLVQTTLF